MDGLDASGLKDTDFIYGNCLAPNFSATNFGFL
jgi:hypothetical protein